MKPESNPLPTFEILETENGAYQTTLTNKYRKKNKWTAPDTKLVVSYIPGTITQIIAKKGQLVKKGEPLLTFNAMKMANTYAAPIEGIVEDILVEPGQPVPKGAALIKFK